MSVVFFSAYRNHENSRIEANNAMMAMLAGSRLAEHMLSLTSGSKRLLPEIFPAVQHVDRMNLRVDSARVLLSEAEKHLSAMAVPYTLALHEDYVVTCLKLLQRASLINSQGVKAASPKNMHQKFEAAAGASLSPISVEQFNFLRLLRNAIIHAGGLPSSDLMDCTTNFTEVGAEHWERLTGIRPDALVTAGNKITLQQGELVAALAVTKSLADQINVGLQSALPREVWADLLCEEFEMELGDKHKHMNQRLRKLPGYARQHFGVLRFSKQELEKAAQRATW
ncbi:hypothetical protein [Streptomyces sp. NPDC004783]|uniref:hypothetical protein n=1 Tax=Streptomyces sp. NPDC004783 TaxID=3154459 RepID=UPI0033B57626